MQASTGSRQSLWGHVAFADAGMGAALIAAATERLRKGSGDMVELVSVGTCREGRWSQMEEEEVERESERYEGRIDNDDDEKDDRWKGHRC